MMVKRPRNITDEELATKPQDFDHPDTFPTIMSYQRQRIRLNELCRHVSDLTPNLTVEQMSADTVLVLDREFQDLIDDLPVHLKMDQASRHQCEYLDVAQPHIPPQRFTCNLLIESRRCQFHMHFLVKASYDSSYAASRAQCLKSARFLIAILTVDEGAHLPAKFVAGGPLHLFFYATVVLLMDLFVNKDPSTTESRTFEVERAFKTIESAKRRSKFASVLLDSLVAIVTKHRIPVHPPKAEMNPPPVVSDSFLMPLAQNMQTDSTISAPSMQPVADFMEFDDLWRSFVQPGSNVELNWDAVMNDLDMLV